MLRNSLLVSSLLSNSEAWYNVTTSELDYLETVDLMLLRNILKAPKSTLSIEKKAFEDLEFLKSTHSKVKHVKHPVMKMQRYFMANQMKISNEEIQLIFKLMCRVTELKSNLKGNYDSHECEVCEKEEETQEHILKCTKKVNMKKSEKENDEVSYQWYSKFLVVQ
jgi:hypothetical protein